MSNLLRTKARNAAKARLLAIEKLEDRAVPATVAFFNTDTLTVLGDTANNTLVVAADNAGNLTVTDNGATVTIQVFGSNPATRANLRQANVFADGGNDSILLDRTLNTGTSGPVGFFAPNATLSGGDGNDTIQVNSGGFLGTVDANGVIQGQILGNATMLGGLGNDTLISGFGNDVMLGEDGDDSYVWNPGTLTDTWDGGAGNDTATVIGNGNGAGDAFVLSAGKAGHTLFQRVNLVQFAVDINNTETIVLQPDSNATGGADSVTINDLTGVNSLKTVIVNAGSGDDKVSAATQANRAISMRFFGEDGNDSILGGFGRDFLSGGNGNDTVQGGGVAPALDGTNDSVINGDAGNDMVISGFGNDKMTGGDGDDTYVWNPGTINDTWDGGAGNDNAIIIGNGNGAGDAFQLTTGRNGFEVLFQRTNLVPFTVDINGTETVTMQTDSNSTGGADTITVGDLTGVTTLKTVVAKGGNGNDVISAAKQMNRAVSMRFFGEGGNDTILGGFGKDFLSGGGGNDTVQGGGVAPALDGSNDSVINGDGGNDIVISGFGNDKMTGGDGDDTYVWLPGTINDTWDGGAGNDNAVIVGNDNNQGDAFTLGLGTVPGFEVRFARTNLVPFTVDINATETVTMVTQSGNDVVTVGSLAGTAVTSVVVDAGLGDDTVNAKATNVSTVIRGGDGNDLLLGGTNNDVIEGGAGNDLMGGYGGNDVMTGEAGNDFLCGGDGSDTLLGGDGNDTLTGGGSDGDPDVLVGGAGADTFYRFANESDFFADFNAAEGDVFKDFLTGVVPF